MSKWTTDHTYKFVQEYLKHECLYNVKCGTYKNKYARSNALLKISRAMNMPNFGVKEAYVKLRNIRSTYCQELKKIKETALTASDSSEIYVPNLKWFSLYDSSQNSLSGIKLEVHESQNCLLTQFISWLNMSSPEDEKPLFVDKKGGKVALHGDHQYHLVRKYKSGASILRCSKYRRTKCRGSITIQDSKVIKCMDHSCGADVSKNFRLKKKAAIKNLARNSDESIPRLSENRIIYLVRDTKEDVDQTTQDDVSDSEVDQSEHVETTWVTQNDVEESDDGESEEQPINPIAKRKRTFTDRRVETLSKTIGTGNSTSTDAFENEFDIFGRSVAAQLKNMPLHLAIEAQMFIQNYLSKVRLRELGRKIIKRSASVNSSDKE